MAEVIWSELAKEDLQEQSVLVRDLNLSKYETIPDGFEALSKIRYKDKGAYSELFKIELTIMIKIVG